MVRFNDLNSALRIGRVLSNASGEYGGDLLGSIGFAGTWEASDYYEL